MRTWVLSMVAGLAVAGCVTGPTPYPPEWPGRSQATGCQITGVYQDFGVQSAYSTYQYTGHLKSLLREGLYGAADDKSNEPVHVWLDQAAPKMRVGSDASMPPEPLRPNGGVVCNSDGSLTLRFDAEFGSSYWHADVTAWSAADASLIVRLEVTIRPKGLPSLLSSYELHWFRFEQVR